MDTELWENPMSNEMYILSADYCNVQQLLQLVQ